MALSTWTKYLAQQERDVRNTSPQQMDLKSQGSNWDGSPRSPPKSARPYESLLLEAKHPTFENYSPADFEESSGSLGTEGGVC